MRARQHIGKRGVDPVGDAGEQERVGQAAREQVGVTLSYDPAYRRLSYPGGDVPLSTGVCTDVLIRALRQQGHSIQQRRKLSHPA